MRQIGAEVKFTRKTIRVQGLLYNWVKDKNFVRRFLDGI
jgi:hypothetical protein